MAFNVGVALPSSLLTRKQAEEWLALIEQHIKNPNGGWAYCLDCKTGVKDSSHKGHHILDTHYEETDEYGVKKFLEFLLKKK